LMRLFGAIRASLIAESRPSSLLTDATSPALRRGSDWGHGVSCDAGLGNIYGFRVVWVLRSQQDVTPPIGSQVIFEVILALAFGLQGRPC
jgi:hypothetical protein